MKHTALLNTFEYFLAAKVTPNIFYRMLFEKDDTKLKVKVKGYIDGEKQIYHMVCDTVRKHIQNYELIKITTDDVTITIDCYDFIKYLVKRNSDYIRSHTYHLDNNDVERFIGEAKGNCRVWEYANIIDILDSAGLEVSKYM